MAVGAIRERDQIGHTTTVDGTDPLSVTPWSDVVARGALPRQDAPGPSSIAVRFETARTGPGYQHRIDPDSDDLALVEPLGLTVSL